MLLPLLSRQAAERTKIHVVILKYIAATKDSDIYIVVNPISIYIHVISPPLLVIDVYGASKYSISPI